MKAKPVPSEVSEMRQSLDDFARTARHVTRAARQSQRNLRLSLSPPPKNPAAEPPAPSPKE
jgi:16S rRNA U1498 N3-methylase RsmE